MLSRRNSRCRSYPRGRGGRTEGERTKIGFPYFIFFFVSFFGFVFITIIATPLSRALRRILFLFNIIVSNFFKLYSGTVVSYLRLRFVYVLCAFVLLFLLGDTASRRKKRKAKGEKLRSPEKAPVSRSPSSPPSKNQP